MVLSLEQQMGMIAVSVEMERERGGSAPNLPTDTKPPPFITQVPLIDVFERLKRVKADTWQKDFCHRLQTATENRYIKGVRALIHAQPQLGKSIILAQTDDYYFVTNIPPDNKAIDSMLDRTFGKATQPVEVSDISEDRAVQIAQDVYAQLLKEGFAENAVRAFVKKRYEVDEGLITQSIN